MEPGILGIKWRIVVLGIVIIIRDQLDVIHYKYLLSLVHVNSPPRHPVYIYVLEP